MKISYFFFILTLYTLLISGCKKESSKQYVLSDPLTTGLETAQTHLKEGDPQNAICILEGLHQYYFNNIEVLEALAFTHSSQKNHLEAAFYFEEVARLNPEYTNLLLYAAQAYSEEKDWEAAKNCYMRYLQIYPEDGSTWKLLAKSYSALNLPDEAIGAYMQALHEDKGSPNALESIAIGKLYLKKKDYSQANDWYEIALYQAESRPFALLGQAELYYKIKRPEVALKKISVLETEYPDFKNLNPVVALKRELNRWKEKQTIEQKSKVLLSTISKSPMLQAPSELATIQFTDPIQRSLLETTQTPSPNAYPTTACIATGNVNNTTKIITSLINEDSLAFAPKQISTSTALTSSTPDSATIPTSDPNLITISSSTHIPTPLTSLQLSTQADALLESNQIDSAIQLYWQSIQQSSQQASTWLKISQAYEKKGDFKTAQKTALEALRIDPNSELITIHYLDILKQLNSSDQLLQEFRKAKNRFPNSADITVSYAQIFIEMQNNIRNARLICQEFLDQYPNNSGREKVEQELKYINTLIQTRSNH